MGSRYSIRHLQEIVELRKAGHSLRELGGRSPIPTSVILQLVRQPGLCEDLAREAAALLAEVRNANDLYRPWPAVRLIAALGLDFRGTQCLEDQFENEASICLDALLEFLSPDVRDIEGAITYALPTARVPNYGVVSYGATIGRLRELDLGPAFQSKLDERCKLLLQGKIKGNLRSALARSGVSQRSSAKGARSHLES